MRNTAPSIALLSLLPQAHTCQSKGVSMQRTIWEWIVRMDDRIGGVMLDAGIAIALAALGTALLRSLLAYL
jgi:hypothetical protein